MALRTPKALPYASNTFPGLHRGVVSITAAQAGVLDVDLGIKHNNFTVNLNVMGGATEGANGYDEYWDYHPTRRGVFRITIMKRPAAFGAWIAATLALRVSFTAQEGTSTTGVTSP